MDTVKILYFMSVMCLFSGYKCSAINVTTLVVSEYACDDINITTDNDKTKVTYAPVVYSDVYDNEDAILKLISNYEMVRLSDYGNIETIQTEGCYVIDTASFPDWYQKTIMPLFYQPTQPFKHCSTSEYPLAGLIAGTCGCIPLSYYLSTYDGRITLLKADNFRCTQYSSQNTYNHQYKGFIYMSVFNLQKYWKSLPTGPVSCHILSRYLLSEGFEDMYYYSRPGLSKDKGYPYSGETQTMLYTYDKSFKRSRTCVSLLRKYDTLFVETHACNIPMKYICWKITAQQTEDTTLLIAGVTVAILIIATLVIVIVIKRRFHQKTDSNNGDTEDNNTGIDEHTIDSSHDESATGHNDDAMPDKTAANDGSSTCHTSDDGSVPWRLATNDGSATGHTSDDGAVPGRIDASQSTTCDAVPGRVGSGYNFFYSNKDH